MSGNNDPHEHKTTVRNALWRARRLAVVCMISALCMPQVFAQAAPASLAPCPPSATSTASFSLVSAPATLVIKPSRQAQSAIATGQFYVKNEGSVPLSRWCAVAYMSDYADVPQKTKISMPGTPPSDSIICRDWLVQAGEVRELVLTVEADPNRLPDSGLVVVAATGQGQMDKGGDIKATGNKRQGTNSPPRGKRGGATSRAAASAQASPCTVNAKQISQAVVVTSVNSATHGFWMVLLTGLPALVFLAVCLFVFRGKLSHSMGASQWSFSSSAATNLAVVGTLLGTALASTALPDFPHYMTKQSYVALSLLFGVLAGLSPVLYNFCCKPVGMNQTNPALLDFQGWVWLFLSADALTLWAVSGQLSTLCLLFNEFAARQHIARGSTWAAWTVAAAIVVALFFYCGRTASYYVSKHPERIGAAVLSGAPLPRWTAL